MKAKVFKKFGNFSGYLEERSCVICDSPPPPELIFMKKDNIGIWKCPGCDLHYASPRFDEDSLLNIYENESFTDLSSFDNWSYVEWSKSGARSWSVGKLKVEMMDKYLKRNDRILDVGCSFGEFVSYADHHGYRCEGIDCSEMLMNIAVNKVKIKAEVVDVKDFRPPYKFNGIFIWDVLEHLFDPVDVLKSCNRLLEDNGYIFAQVPNHKGISNRLKSFANRIGLSKNDFGHFGFPYHIYFFDKKSLGALVEKAGFEAVHFESWSHQMKEGKKGFFSDLVSSFTSRNCLTDYIIVVAKKIKSVE